jgi:hypothetical protein
MGHIPGPFYFAVDDQDPEKGLRDPTVGPRLSNGWGDARHLPSVLVENHALKPYEQRVLGTYVFLESTLRTVGEQAAGLREAIRSDRSRRTANLTLDWRTPETAKPAIAEVLAIESRRVPSSISGRQRVEWTGKPVRLRLPLWRQNEPAASATRPRAYWIPPAWSEVATRLALHGITLERVAGGRDVDVEMLRIREAKLDSVPYEGRVRMTPRVERCIVRRTFPSGSLRVPTDQPLGDLAMLLLEPESPDSFFQWGFFAAVLQRTEYAEEYILELMAERMLAESEALRAQFATALNDARFAADPAARLRWFYERTPFFDSEANLYPVARELP